MRKSYIMRTEKIKDYVKEANKYLSESERRSAKITLRRVKK